MLVYLKTNFTHWSLKILDHDMTDICFIIMRLWKENINFNYTIIILRENGIRAKYVAKGSKYPSSLLTTSARYIVMDYYDIPTDLYPNMFTHLVSFGSRFVPCFARIGTLMPCLMHILLAVSLRRMMTPSNGNIFCVTGYFSGEFTGHLWNPRTKASDAELWCFFWSAPE